MLLFLAFHFMNSIFLCAKKSLPGSNMFECWLLESDLFCYPSEITLYIVEDRNQSCFLLLFPFSFNFWKLHLLFCVSYVYVVWMWKSEDSFQESSLHHVCIRDQTPPSCLVSPSSSFLNLYYFYGWNFSCFFSVYCEDYSFLTDLLFAPLLKNRKKKSSMFR